MPMHVSMKRLIAYHHACNDVRQCTLQSCGRAHEGCNGTHAQLHVWWHRIKQWLGINDMDPAPHLDHGHCRSCRISQELGSETVECATVRTNRRGREASRCIQARRHCVIMTRPRPRSERCTARSRAHLNRYEQKSGGSDCSCMRVQVQTWYDLDLNKCWCILVGVCMVVSRQLSGKLVASGGEMVWMGDGETVGGLPRPSAMLHPGSA